MLEVAILLHTVLHFVGVGFEHVLGLLEVENLSILDHELGLEISELNLEIGRDGVRNSLECHIDSSFLLTLLNFKFLLLCWRWLFWSLLLFSGCSLTLSSWRVGLGFLLGGSGLDTASRLDGDFLLLSPVLGHFNTIKSGNLIDVILDPDAEFGCAAWYISLGAFATSNVVLGDRLGKTLQKLSLVTVVDLELHETLLVVEFELLHKRELLSKIEEVTIFFRFFCLVGLWVSKLVVHIDWHVVVIVHCECLHIEVRSHHGAVES